MEKDRRDINKTLHDFIGDLIDRDGEAKIHTVSLESSSREFRLHLYHSPGLDQDEIDAWTDSFLTLLIARFPEQGFSCPEVCCEFHVCAAGISPKTIGTVIRSRLIH